MGKRNQSVCVDTELIQARLAEPKLTVSRASKLKGVKKIYDRRISFTQDLAVHYLELDPVKYERPVRDSWVEILAEKMSNGLFCVEDVDINIAVCRWDSKERRLNGQHTCWARLSMPFSWKPKVHVVKYEVRTEDDYRLLYMQKDQIAVRTKSHRDQVGLVGTREYQDFPARVVGKIAKGFSYWFFEPPIKATSEAICEQLRGKYAEAGQLVGKLVEVALSLKCAHLDRQPVFAAMFETVENDSSRALEFWEKIAHGLQFKSQRDPAKVLDKYLHEVSIHGTGAGRRRTVGPAHAYNVCVGCFNAFRGGKMLSKTPPGRLDHRAQVR